MQIYFIHASSYPNYKNLYYKIRHSNLNIKHNIIFPHENNSDAVNSRNIIKNSDLIIAEVSYPSTGLGIELGWAEVYNKKILFIYKKDSVLSSSLKIISSDFIEYESLEDLILKLLQKYTSPP